MPAFFDFALAEARRTGFDVQTLGGIKPYLATYLAERSRRDAEAAKRQAYRRRQLDEEAARAREAQALAAARDRFATLPATEQQAIRSEAEAKAAKFPSGSLRQAMIDHHIGRIAAERQREKHEAA